MVNKPQINNIIIIIIVIGEVPMDWICEQASLIQKEVAQGTNPRMNTVSKRLLKAGL